MKKNNLFLFQNLNIRTRPEITELKIPESDPKYRNIRGFIPLYWNTENLKYPIQTRTGIRTPTLVSSHNLIERKSQSTCIKRLWSLWTKEFIVYGGVKCRQEIYTKKCRQEKHGMDHGNFDHEIFSICVNV